jgi:LacI family transcriptional regulator
MVRTRNRPTLKDVAKLSNCSIAVVSTVVNNAKGNTLVSDEMRDRVNRAARELGYRAHFASRTLKEKCSRTLGVYFPPVPWAGAGYGYEGAMIRGVEQACREFNYDLLLVNMAGDNDAQACMDKFAESRIDGLVLMNVADQHDWLPRLLDISSNVVAVDYSGKVDHLHAMLFDNVAAIRLGLEHLATLGHRRIGFISSCKRHIHQDTFDRKLAFIDLVKTMGLDDDSKLIFDHETLGRSLELDEDCCNIEGTHSAKYFAKMGDDRPTAILAYNDLTANACMNQFTAIGIQTPRDISIMGVDDAELCRRVYPTLTSISHPLPEMGYAAASFLIKRSAPELRQSSQGNQIIRQIFAPTLVPRQSTAALG